MYRGFCNSVQPCFALPASKNSNTSRPSRNADSFTFRKLQNAEGSDSQSDTRESPRDTVDRFETIHWAPFCIPWKCLCCREGPDDAPDPYRSGAAPMAGGTPMFLVQKLCGLFLGSFAGFSLGSFAGFSLGSFTGFPWVPLQAFPWVPLRAFPWVPLQAFPWALCRLSLGALAVASLPFWGARRTSSPLSASRFG